MKTPNTHTKRIDSLIACFTKTNRHAKQKHATTNKYVLTRSPSFSTLEAFWSNPLTPTFGRSSNDIHSTPWTCDVPHHCFPAPSSVLLFTLQWRYVKKSYATLVFNQWGNLESGGHGPRATGAVEKALSPASSARQMILLHTLSRFPRRTLKVLGTRKSLLDYRWIGGRQPEEFYAARAPGPSTVQSIFHLLDLCWKPTRMDESGWMDEHHFGTAHQPFPRVADRVSSENRAQGCTPHSVVSHLSQPKCAWYYRVL
jgi:hypothetical protein